MDGESNSTCSESMFFIIIINEASDAKSFTQTQIKSETDVSVHSTMLRDLSGSSD